MMFINQGGTEVQSCGCWPLLSDAGLHRPNLDIRNDADTDATFTRSSTLYDHQGHSVVTIDGVYKTLTVLSPVSHH